MNKNEKLQMIVRDLTHIFRMEDGFKENHWGRGFIAGVFLSLEAVGRTDILSPDGDPSKPQEDDWIDECAREVMERLPTYDFSDRNRSAPTIR